jgi:hypothetical protein
MDKGNRRSRERIESARRVASISGDQLRIECHVIAIGQSRTNAMLPHQLVDTVEVLWQQLPVSSAQD